MEQNKDCFWFENYRKEGVFTEYNFAIELLDIFDEYLRIKSTDLFKNHIKLVVEKLGDYKNVRNFVKLIPPENLFAWIVAYLTKDNKYFQLIFDKHNIIPKEFQNDQWIINVGNLLLEKTFNFYCLENARLIEKNNSIVNTIVLNDKRNQIMIDKLLEEIHSVKENENELQKKLDEVQKTNSSLENGLKDLQERVAKIELRDTIKLSMTYLYNILHYKFNSSEGKKDKYSDKLN
jgi:FtsZ-binding cell division protein ZapB